MNRVVQQKLKQMMDLCKNRGVRRLALFGSAATGSFDRSSSDLDLIVEFNPMQPGDPKQFLGGVPYDTPKMFWDMGVRDRENL